MSRTGWRYVRVGLVAAVSIASGAACSSDSRRGSPTEPVQPGQDAAFVFVTAGFQHSCALTGDGAAFCWGHNTSRGQLGNGTWLDSSIPTQVRGDVRFHMLSGGGNHTCGVTSTGKGYCWGSNSYGQLGSGATADTNEPVAVAGGLTFTSIHAGEFSTCGLTTTGAAYCWGQNLSGQLGNGEGSAFISNVPVPVAGELRFQGLGVGHQHACGVTTDGAAYCWGRNPFGQLGDNSKTDRNRPVPVLGGLTFAGPIGASQHNSCALTAAGRTYCWGDNWHNQVGNGVGRGSFGTPQEVVGVPDLVQLGIGGDHACGVTRDGTAWCWGDNMRGSLGVFNQESYNAPTPARADHAFAMVSGGGWDHYCAATTGGDIYCWGWNEKGQLGDGSTSTRHTPTQVRRK